MLRGGDYVASAVAVDELELGCGETHEYLPICTCVDIDKWIKRLDALLVRFSANNDREAWCRVLYTKNVISAYRR